jgi:hypothetical protein
MYHIKYSCVLTATYIVLLVMNKHNGDDSPQTSIPPVGFERTISAGERPQTYALERAATGTGY